MLVTPARQPDRQAVAGGTPPAPWTGYGTRATPSRATASTQRRSRCDFPAVPRRIRPRTPRLARRRSWLRSRPRRRRADPRRGRPGTLRPRCCLTPTTVGELRRTDAADHRKRDQDGAGPQQRPPGVPITWDRSSEGTSRRKPMPTPPPPPLPYDFLPPVPSFDLRSDDV